MTCLLVAVFTMASEGGAVDLQTLLGMAEAYGRTGLRADGMENVTDALLSLEDGYARMLSWASWSAGDPLPTGPEPWLLEFGAGEPTHEMLALLEPGQAVESLMMRVLHEFARGEQPVLPELVDSLVRSEMDDLPGETLELVLQVYGRLGIGGLAESDAVSGLGTPLGRYMAETGTAMRVQDVRAADPLYRVYAARALPEAELAPLLEDPLWAVRYEAAGRVDPALLEPLLEDPVPYVALRAAARMAESGLGDGRTVGELALLPGPVGDQAASMLGAGDSVQLASLLAGDAPGRRLSALQAWLGAGLPVDSGMDASLLMDPYWLVPVVYLEGLAESGDSARAAAKAERLLSTSDDRNLREALSSFLGREAELPDARLPEGLEECGCYDRAVIRTDEGDIMLTLLTDIAPVTCRAFCWLACGGFYDGLYFHRVIPGFVAQAGCPQGNGYGGPGFSIPNERSLVRFRRGVVGMADSGLDTGGSQFFIMLDDHDRLDCRYTAFASVSEGDPILDRLVVGTRIQSVSLLRPGD